MNAVANGVKHMKNIIQRYKTTVATSVLYLSDVSVNSIPTIILVSINHLCTDIVTGKYCDPGPHMKYGQFSTGGKISKEKFAISYNLLIHDQCNTRS